MSAVPSAGGFPPDFVLTLGSVQFKKFEIPRELGGGLTQSTFIHKYPGGARTVDTMGPDYDTLEWSGTFLDSDAESRCLDLKALAAAGSEITLTFSQFSYQVVIAKFTFKFRRYYQIDYSISLTVIADNSNPIGDAGQSDTGATGTQGPSTTDNPDESVMQQDVADVADDAGQIDNGVLSGAVGSITSLVDSVDSIVGMGQSDLASLSGFVNTALSTANGLVSTFDSAVVAAGAVANFVSGTTPQAFIATLNALSAANYNLCYAADAANKLSRLQLSVVSLQAQ
jgi:hypothetical protein